LHDESKSLAGELSQERNTIVKEQLKNNQILQDLFIFDERMQIVNETTETRGKQI
jgi:hypothetical protein